MVIEADVQSVVNRYGRALEVPRLIFDLYPNPRPQGAPPMPLRALPAAIAMSVIGAFEGFAEDLTAALLYKQGFGWAQIAHHANMTNPSVTTLRDKLEHVGVNVQQPAGWATPLPKQTSVTGWNVSAPVQWDDLLTLSDGWMQVRHCLAHGLATGLGPEVWPAPVDNRSSRNQQSNRHPSASDVLATTSSADRKGLHFWSAVACARIYSVGAAVLAESVATDRGETVDTAVLHRFDSV